MPSSSLGGMDDQGSISPKRLSNRKWPAQNLAQRLMARELGLGLTTRALLAGSEINLNRSLYQNIVPNFSVTNIRMTEPREYIRKFSLDGRYFITISDNLSSLNVYRFKGSEMGPKYFAKNNSEELEDIVMTECGGVGDNKKIRSSIFTEFFTLAFKVPVPGTHSISRDICLFTPDSKYLLICSSGPSESGFNIHPDLNDSLDMEVFLRDYRLYAVNLDTGKADSTLDFPNDRLALSLKNAVYMLDRMIVVLSIQYQIIYILWLTRDGKMEEIHRIGENCLEKVILSPRWDPDGSPLSTFKQKLASFLVERFLDEKDPDDEVQGRRFNKYIEFIGKIRMWKVQLLDDNTLLIKFAEEKYLFSIPQEYDNVSMLVVYEIEEERILRVVENCKEEVITLYGGYFDCLQNMERLPGGRHCTNATNNFFAKQAYQRCIDSLPEDSRTKQVGGQLPIPAQNFAVSPYVDHSIFKFDDVCISSMERPRSLTYSNIKFFARDSNRVCFILEKAKSVTLRASRSSDISHPPNSNYVSFHPHEPVAISVQRVENRYFYNLHFRLDLPAFEPMDIIL